MIYEARGKGFQKFVVVYSYIVQFIIIFGFLLSLSQFAKLIMHITNPNELQKYAKLIQMLVETPFT